MNRDELLKERLRIVLTDISAAREACDALLKDAPTTGQRQEDLQRNLESAIAQVAWYLNALREFSSSKSRPTPEKPQ